MRAHAAPTELHQAQPAAWRFFIHTCSMDAVVAHMSNNDAACSCKVADLAEHAVLRLRNAHLVAAAQLGELVWMMRGLVRPCAKPVIHAVC